MAKANIEASVESARSWTLSDEGRAAIKAALKDARDVKKALCEASRLDPEMLHQPITL